MTRRDQLGSSTARTALAAGVAATALLIAPAALAQNDGARNNREIGTVAAANRDIVGTPPAAARRDLTLGVRIFQDERIETSDVGAGQFLFLDQTSLRVSPNSDLVLNRYVFDPDTSTGEMTMTMGRGVLRFIGGRISKDNEVVVRTPHTTIGIRGGMMNVAVTETSTRVHHVAGVFTRVGETVVTRTNGLVVVEETTDESGQTTTETTFIANASDADLEQFYGPAAAGEGDGGVTDPPSQAQVEQDAENAGITPDTDDPAAPPQSTTDAAPPPDEAATDDAETPGLQTLADEQSATDAIADEATDETVMEFLAAAPEPAPVAPDPAPAEPPAPTIDTTGFVGARFLGDDTDFFPVFGGGFPRALPGQANIVVRTDITDGIEDLVVFEFLENGLIQATTSSGASTTFLTSLSGAGLAPEDSAFVGTDTEGFFFVSPNDDFFVSAIELFDPTENAASDPELVLAFAGAPTPTSVLQEISTDDLEVREFTLSENIFTGFDNPLPEIFGDVFGEVGGADAAGLLLIPEPNAPLVPDPAGGIGFMADTDTRILYGFVDIQGGEGPGQQSILGLGTARTPVTPAGFPTSGSSLYYQAQLDATNGASRGFIDFGFLPTESGETLFGPDANFFVLGQGSAFFEDDDPDFEAGEVFFEASAPTGDPTPGFDSFGDTRVGVLTDTINVLASERIALATSFDPVASPTFFGGPGPVDPEFSFAFTGGFAAGVGRPTVFSATGSGVELVGIPYTVVTDSPGDVRFAFSPDSNTLAAEFSDVDAGSVGFASTSFDAAVNGAGALQDAQFNFGGSGDSSSAFLTDDVFGARFAFGETGSLTQAPLAANGEPLVGPTTFPGFPGFLFQGAFRGVVVSSGLVGDGGLGITQPEYLRWGFWNAEVRFDGSASGFNAGRTDFIPIGFFVTGVVSDISSVLAQTGTASYSGFAGATVAELLPSGEFATYVDAGSFTLDYTFAPGGGTGALSVSDIVGGGVTLTSTVTGQTAAGGPHFTGAFAEGAGGSVTGAFFTGGGDPVAATAGQFNGGLITPDGNLAAVSGVFGGDKQ